MSISKHLREHAILGIPAAAGKQLQARPNTVAFIGDSITKGGVGWEKENNAVISGQAWLTVCGSPDYTCGTGSATLEFRISDNACRWSAPGDSFGAWTVLVAGYNIIPSATAGMRLIIGVKMDWLPVSNQSISLTMAVAYNRFSASGHWTWAQQKTGHWFRNVSALGVTGDYSHHVLARLGQLWQIDPWGAAVAEPPGHVVVLVGTNDVGDGAVTSTTVINNLTAIKNYIIGRGAIPIFCTLMARGSMSAAQFQTMQEINAGIFAMGEDDTRVQVVDYFAATVDHLLTAGAPATNYMDTDQLHPVNLGGYVAGEALAATLTAISGNRTGKAISRFAGGIYNKYRNGQFIGTGGTNGTGVSGTVTASYVGARGGTTLTATASIVSSAYDSNWQRYVCTGAAAGDSITHQLTVANADTYATLVAMGLVAGDAIITEVEYSITSATAVRDVVLALQIFNGSTWEFVFAGYDTAVGRKTLPDAAYSGKIQTPRIVLPASAQKVRIVASVEFNAGGAATVDFRNLGLYKVS